MKFLKQGFAVFVSSCLVLGAAHDAFAEQANQSVLAPAQPTRWTTDQLQQLAAPIALYPDALVAQILAASTHPVELVEANRWMQEHPALTGDALAVEVNKQSWDPSVQALTQFPSVLANADQNLTWASALGDAYLNQPQELMAAVQVMRQRAEEAGSLQSTGQQTVSTQDQTITVEPTAPDVVYLPEYDPWLAYGTPIAVWPGWYPYSGLYLDGPGIAFGIGFGLGYFGGYSWGWHHWRPDWNRRTVVYNHHPYISRSGTMTNRNDYLHGHENFDRTQAFHDERGFFANSGPHVSTAPQRGFAESNARFDSNPGRFSRFGNEGFAREPSGEGRAGFGGFAHEGGNAYGEGSHGGGGHR